jgi:hypothetical protein
MALHPEVLNELAVEIAATLQLVVRMSLLTQSGHSCRHGLFGWRPVDGVEAARPFQYPLGVEIGWRLDP